jgi:hypothetical protein
MQRRMMNDNKTLMAGTVYFQVLSSPLPKKSLIPVQDFKPSAFPTESRKCKIPDITRNRRSGFEPCDVQTHSLTATQHECPEYFDN